MRSLKNSQSYLLQAITIADEILANAQQSNGDLFWRTTYSTVGDTNILYQSNESIYNGTGGIVLLFLELYKETKDEKYRIAAESGIAWSVKHIEMMNSDYFAFFTGRMSIVFILLKAYDILQNPSYLSTALRLTKPVRNFLDNEINDLINGLSGTLLVLLHLYSVTYEDWILDEINAFTLKLIDRAQASKYGVYWDRTEKVIKPLCGFSHGASGIGYVFLELGNFFNNSSLLWLGEAAFAYEREHFNQERNNWTDLRKGIDVFQDEDSFLQAYLANDMPFFTEGRTMTAWCHGSPGIGLARLRAFELLKKPDYLEEANAAAISTEVALLDEYRYNSFNLCHGNFGNLELLIEFASQIPQKNYTDTIEKMAEDCIQHKKDNGFYASGIAHQQEDWSLFLGNAGIAYSFLRIYNVHDHKSILVPNVDRQNIFTCRLDTVNASLINTALIKKRFPRTLSLLLRLFPDQTNTFLSANSKSLSVVDEWLDFVEHQIAMHPEFTLVKETAAFEKFIWNQDCNQPSFAYSYFKNRLLTKKAKAVLEMSAIEFERVSICVRSDLVVKKLSHLSDEALETIDPTNLTAAATEIRVILFPDYWGIREIKIENDLLPVLLDVFSSQRVIKDGVKMVLDFFEDLRLQDEIEHATALIISQIQEGLAVGLFEIE